MTATAYTDAVKQYNAANEEWSRMPHDAPAADRKRVLDAFITAAAKCIGTCPIASDRLWYEEKHMMAVELRAKLA